MSALPSPTPARLSQSDQLGYAREIMSIEGRTVLNLADRLDDAFLRAVDFLYRCQGSVIVTGMGKAGIIGQKVAATLASTGTRSHYLHPAEAVHGDLGRIHADDIILVLSKDGETEEIVRLLPLVERLKVPIVAVTSRRASTLGRTATVTVELGPVEEACSLGLAPSTSTTAMLAMGDALALVTSRLRGFRREDFALFHPAGSLGRQLSKVEEHMRGLEECRVAQESLSVREVYVQWSGPKRRPGAIMLVDDAGRLSGIFTDSDLARLLERRLDAAIDGEISAVMTRQPRTVPLGSMMVDAVAIMAERKLSELPVIDAEGKPVGLVDITDVVSLFPEIAADEPEGATVPFHKDAATSSRHSQPPKPKSKLFTRAPLQDSTGETPLPPTGRENSDPRKE